jgi:hypothetical protein
LFLFFALAEREKQKQKIEKYLAAAGKNQFEADTA